MWLGGRRLEQPPLSGSAGSRRQRVAGLCDVGDGIGACSRVADGCFPTPLSISANTTYVATYYAPTGQFAPRTVV
jgi:hypothetical protein